MSYSYYLDFKSTLSPERVLGRLVDLAEFDMKDGFVESDEIFVSISEARPLTKQLMLEKIGLDITLTGSVEIHGWSIDREIRAIRSCVALIKDCAESAVFRAEDSVVLIFRNGMLEIDDSPDFFDPVRLLALEEERYVRKNLGLKTL